MTGSDVASELAFHLVCMVMNSCRLFGRGKVKGYTKIVAFTFSTIEKQGEMQANQEYLKKKYGDNNEGFNNEFIQIDKNWSSESLAKILSLKCGFDCDQEEEWVPNFDSGLTLGIYIAAHGGRDGYGDLDLNVLGKALGLMSMWSGYAIRKIALDACYSAGTTSTKIMVDSKDQKENIGALTLGKAVAKLYDDYGKLEILKGCLLSGYRDLVIKFDSELDYYKGLLKQGKIKISEDEKRNFSMKTSVQRGASLIPVRFPEKPKGLGEPWSYLAKNGNKSRNSEWVNIQHIDHNSKYSEYIKSINLYLNTKICWEFSGVSWMSVGLNKYKYVNDMFNYVKICLQDGYYKVEAVSDPKWVRK